MKFRTRETTTFLYVLFRDLKGFSAEDLHKEARRAGKLAVGFHYLVRESGVVALGREADAVADYDMENCDSAIYVLVDQGQRKRPTDSQRTAVKALIVAITERHPEVKIIKQHQ